MPKDRKNAIQKGYLDKLKANHKKDSQPLQTQTLNTIQTNNLN